MSTSSVEQLEHEFVVQLPDEPREGVLYISMEFGTALHLCCCGCREKVLTPLRPNRWRMTFDGENIWLCPSIGNWNFDCKSHYWVLGSRVRWAAQMTKEEIEAVRGHAREMSAAFYGDGAGGPGDAKAKPTSARKRGRWERVKHFFSH